jgi:uncharacterized protein
MRARLFVFSLFVVTLAALALPRAAGPAPDPVYDTKATATWRETREKDLQSPTGWLTVSGLFFLKTGANVVGADPASDVPLPAGSVPARLGVITRQDDKTWFEPEAGAGVSVNDSLINARTELTPASRVKAGRITFFLHKSGDRLAIRVRDPESALRKEFHGLRWYPIRAEWRITSKFTAYDVPKPVTVQNVLGDIEKYVSPGEVTVQVKDQTIRLQAVRSGQRLWFIFSDASAGRETYPIRFLYAEPPAADGTVVLDFNRAYNPPCAYNPYTTCPRPPAQNFVKLAIAAGEKRY